MGEIVLASFDWLESVFNALPNFVGAMIVSIICGLVIGLERESRGKPAGARTLVLICLGSAMFVQLSRMVAGNFGDPGRVAAQIVSGIGFLGAGAILHQSEKGYIAGLTTAASIWVTAAVGMIVGAEKYFFALISTGIVVGALRVLRQLEKKLFYTRHIDPRRISFDPKSGKTEWKLLGILEENMIQPEEYRFNYTDDPKLPVLELSYCHTNRNHRSFLTEVAKMKDVLGISRASRSPAHSPRVPS